MPKMKTKSGAKKRFKMTGTGKIKFKKPGLRHLLSHKSSDSKRKKVGGAYLNDANVKTLSLCLPYGL